MELNRYPNESPADSVTVIVGPFKPVSYKDMDNWLNSFSAQAWKAVLGAYTAGGMANIVTHLRNKYPDNLLGWRDKDLRHFWNSRTLGYFKTKSERPST